MAKKKRLFEMEFFEKEKHKPITRQELITQKILEEDLKAVKRFDDKNLALVISRMLLMPMEDLIRQSSNPTTLAIYRMVGKMIVEVANTGNARIFRELMDRVVGKVAEVIDVSNHQTAPIYKIVMQEGNFASDRPKLQEQTIELRT